MGVNVTIIHGQVKPKLVPIGELKVGRYAIIRESDIQGLIGAVVCRMHDTVCNGKTISHNCVFDVHEPSVPFVSDHLDRHTLCEYLPVGTTVHLTITED